MTTERALTANQALAAELQRINESLNPLILRAEAAIAALGLGVSAFVPLNQDERVWFGKREGEWRLYVDDYAGQKGKLLQSTSRKTRLEALANLPYLVTVLQESTAEQLERAERILRNAQGYVEGLELRTRDR